MICFVDVETTGLDENTGDLLEAAFVVTDDQLVEVEAIETLTIASQDADAAIAKMDHFVRDMHTYNGLIDAIKSQPSDMRGETQRDLLRKQLIAAFVREPVALVDKCAACKLPLSRHSWNCDTNMPSAYCAKAGAPPGVPSDQAFVQQYQHPLSLTPLAGSTVGFDRRWLRHHVPVLEALFSYRSIDVSSITELAKRFAPQVHAARPKAANAHRALADVRESIAYLKYYRESGFIGGK